ncbi:TetR/AcrR family transcriptional regulator [bacterium]|nr:MAG: TetR/AcrR family transcriptional regulator [bacterium]
MSQSPDPTLPHPTSQAMLEQAAALFAERGYDAVSVREIVDAVGVSRPVLYYHWQNKEALARAIIQDFFKEAQALREAAFAPRNDLAGILRHYAEGMLKLAQVRRATLAFGLAVRFGRTSLRSLFDTMREQDACIMGQWVELLAARGLEPAVAQRVAKTFWSLLFTELVAVLDCPQAVRPSHETASEIVQTLFHGALNQRTPRSHA